MTSKTDDFTHFTKLGTMADFKRDKELAPKTPENVMPNVPRAYIRTKRVRGFLYYYLVKAYRIDGKIRQKVLRYYGVRPPRGKQRNAFRQREAP